jgi:hypothetical protein
VPLLELLVVVSLPPLPPLPVLLDVEVAPPLLALLDDVPVAVPVEPPPHAVSTSAPRSQGEKCEERGILMGDGTGPRAANQALNVRPEPPLFPVDVARRREP